MASLIDKQTLVSKMKKAKSHIRILSVVAFDFDWTELRDVWYSKINAGELKVEIITESEPEVNKRSIIASDRRISGMKRSYELGNFMNILRAPSLDLRKYLLDRKCKNMEPSSDIKGNESDGYKQCFSLRTCYLEIPYPAINIDDEYYICMLFTKFNDIGRFEKVTEKHLWYEGFKHYFHAFFDYEGGAKKYSTEESSKGNRLEVIETYNEKRISMGLLPRDSFLNTTHVKTVVWALVFTRDGRLLIQQRGKNAKDNQGMWDKSVGGHVAVDDIDTVKAAAREIAEELYTLEADEQGKHGKTDYLQVNENKMIFLGEWLPDRRYLIPFKDVNNQKDEAYFFRMDYSFSKVVNNSPRHLPDGRIQDVSVFADVYVCIAAEGFADKIDDLKNGKYKLIELYELKDALNDGVIEVEQNGKVEWTDFNVSPDLSLIVRSSLWQELVQFSDFIRKMYNKN